LVVASVDSLYLYKTDTILADANLAISDPMQSVVDGHLRMESLVIKGKKFPADAKNGSQ
jgi:flagellar biosynthesis/type III secretory pathway ATPase